MRILALVTDAFGGYGGIARYNCDLLLALAGEVPNAEIRVLPRIGAAAVSHPEGGIRQEKAVFKPSLYALRALQLALRFKPELIFCGHIYHGPLASMMSRFLNVPMISQLHGTEVWSPLPGRHLRPLERSDRVLCVSRDTRARYLSQSANHDNSFVLANTVGPEFTPENRGRARARFGTERLYALLTVARLDARNGYKGHDRVIRALPRLRTPDGTPPVYLIAGIGEDRPRLEGLAMRLGVSDQVRFLGKVPDEDLPDLYRAADLFVLPSTGEGFGIVYLESMACGTPVLGLNMGGVADALGDGELGTLIAPDADLAPVLQQLIDAPAPDMPLLVDAVRKRFDMKAFRTRVSQLVKQAETPDPYRTTKPRRKLSSAHSMSMTRAPE